MSDSGVMSAAMGVAERLLALEAAVAELQQLVQGTVTAAPNPKKRARPDPGTAHPDSSNPQLPAPTQGRN